MQFDPTRPIWLQVMNALILDIITGKRPPGEKLPGGRNLALDFGINPNTSARVYQELEKTGLCETRRGMGTFVTDNQAAIAQMREAFVRQAVDDFLEKIKDLRVSPQEAAQMILKRREKNDSGM